MTINSAVDPQLAGGREREERREGAGRRRRVRGARRDDL